jgi:MFS family permease
MVIFSFFRVVLPGRGSFFFAPIFVGSGPDRKGIPLPSHAPARYHGFLPSMTQPSDVSPACLPDDSIYDRGFWLAYTANLLLVCANSLTFRFAEFVADLGGTEELAGEIVRAGLISAIVYRLGLGRAIDRFGPRQIWVLSSLLFLCGVGAFLIPRQLGPLVWIARIAYQSGLAGMFTCSIVHIQNQVPMHRRTEVIGSLGSSGFVGTIIGTQLGDLIFRFVPPGPAQFAAMFGGCSLFGACHAGIVFWLTRKDEHVAPEITPGPFRLLLRYWPGPIVLVSVAMGTSFAVTTVFLTRYATQTGLHGIGMFFLPYAVTAFGCRWILRDWGTTFGRHKMVLWGLGGLAVGQLLFLLVKSDWLFLLPGTVCGFGHALLFPAVVSIGAGRFPVQYRGSGTTLVLGFTELGTAISAPLLGKMIDFGNVAGSTAGFSWMFISAGAAAAVVGLFYAATAARHPDRDLPQPAEPDHPAGRMIEADSETGEIIIVPAKELR